jgi:signal transduction histidine kinase
MTLAAAQPRASRARASTLVDCATAAVLVVVTLASTSGAGLVAGAVGVGTVAVRRRSPTLACATMLVFLAPYQALAGSSLAVAPVAIVLDFYSLGRRAGPRGRHRTEVALLLAAIVVLAVQPDVHGVIDVVAPWFFFGVAPLAAGELIGARESLVERLRTELHQLDEERRANDRLLASVERGRIARDLHDVVGHSVSVMVIQAVAARTVARTDPQAARGALRLVADTGREALAEIRQLADPLRHRTEQLGSAGLRLESLRALAERSSAAGLRVSVETDGVPSRLPAGVELTAIRIIQEALTNAIKHAGAAAATVRVQYEPSAVVLRVRDDGHGRVAAGAHGVTTGYGLLGMRERVALYDGDLRAGTLPGGGFEVVARIPLGGTA